MWAPNVHNLFVLLSVMCLQANLPMVTPHVAVDKALVFEAEAVEAAEEHPHEQVVTVRHYFWRITND